VQRIKRYLAEAQKFVEVQRIKRYLAEAQRFAEVQRIKKYLAEAQKFLEKPHSCFKLQFFPKTQKPP
jgi:hypothetical protein